MDQLDDPSLDDLSQRGEHPRLPDSHLQSPIRPATRQCFLDPKEKVPAFLVQIIQTCPIKVEHLELSSEKCYGILMASATLPPDNPPVSNWVDTNYTESFACVIELLEKTHHGLNLPSPGLKKRIRVEDKFRLSELQRWIDIRVIMQNQKVSKIKDTWLLSGSPPIGLRIGWISAHYFIFGLENEEDNHIFFVFDYDQVMMVCDTLSARTLTLWYNDLLPNGAPGKLKESVILTTYQIFDKCLQEEGNMAYRSISMYEPICFSLLLKQHEKIKRSKEFWSWLVSEIQKENKIYSGQLVEYLEQQDLSCDQLSELHGLYRHWGHPTVHEELGCEKIRVIGQTRSYPKCSTQRRMVGLMNRQFYISFLTKHGRPPRISNTHFLSTKPIGKLFLTTARGVNIYSPEYTLDDWGFVEFDKEFEFDYNVDYTELMDDKSLSPLRSEFRTAYNREKLGYHPGRATTSRRVLEEVLNSDTVNVREICEAIQKRDIPLDWKIIMVHAKEREMKEAPRMFAMMVFQMRIYFCVTEMNLSKIILDYFPQQTMTLTESELLKRLFFIADVMRDPKLLLSVLDHIDFSNWNVGHTRPITAVFFKVIDKLFGTPGLYENTHWFFEQCLVVLASHLNPPPTILTCKSGDPPACNEVWYNHAGGFEGLRQKGWTIITIAMLLYVEHLIGMKSYIIGQGDNQVCKVLIPVPEEYESVENYLALGGDDLENKIQLFLKTLTDVATDLGLMVKPDETATSRNIVIYGKDILFQGALMPQALKRISRTLPDVNEIYPTLETKIATVQTAGAAASQKSYDYCVPFVISTTETLCVIMREIAHLKKQYDISNPDYQVLTSPNFKAFLLHLSSEIGGCPILNPLHFLYRGHPDHFTAYTTYLHTLAPWDELACQVYNTLATGKIQFGRADPELLISNPCAVNVKSPQTISNILRRDLETILIQVTKNRDLSMIFTSQERDNDSQFFTYLMKTRPCQPRILHELFRNTIQGTKLAYISKYKNTKTTRLLYSKAKDVGNMSLKLDQIHIECLQEWIKLYQTCIKQPRNRLVNNICPTKLADLLRNLSWALITNGDPIEGVTIPHPAHQFTAEYMSRDLCKVELNGSKGQVWEEDKDEYIIFRSNSSTKRSLHMTTGPYTHYVGSRTEEKKSGSIYQIPFSGRPLQAAQRVLQITSWAVDPTSRLRVYLEDVAASRTDIPVEILKTATRSITGGSIVHRLDDHVTKRGTLNNIRPNITSHIYFSTDKMGRFSRGAENYNMHFQGAIHYGMAIYGLCAFRDLDFVHGVLLSYSGSCCEEKLLDFLLSNEQPPPVVPSVHDNPLLFASVKLMGKKMSPRTSSIVRYSQTVSSLQAISYLVLERILSQTSIVILGPVEKLTPIVGMISVAEVLSVGIELIIKKVAEYIFLLLPYETSEQVHVLNSIPLHSFMELAYICLLPEVLPHFHEFIGEHFIASLFVHPKNVCQVIKHLINTEVYKILRSSVLKMKTTTLVHFTSSRIGAPRILHMWGRQVWIATGGTVHLDPLIKTLKYPSLISDLFNPIFEAEIMNEILESYDSETYDLICSTCPIRVSAYPVEVVARLSRTERRRTMSMLSKKISTRLEGRRLYRENIAPLDIRTSDYPISASCVGESRGKIFVMSGKTPRTIKLPRTREDHKYRLYGEISTSFMKIIQIIDLEHIIINGSVICLAEGEGSIARLLYMRGAEVVYYDSLVQTTDLVPQRGLGLVPACLSDFPGVIRWGDICALTGGDLTDTDTLQALLDRSPEQGVSLVTCDAEITSNNSPTKACKVFNAWLMLCIKSQAQVAMIKVFCNDPVQMSHFCGAAKAVFREVKFVVPAFSSHENHEGYLVCSNMIEKSYVNQLQAYENFSYHVVSSYHLYETLFREISKRRLNEGPFQETNIALVEKVWNESVILGFSDNGAKVLQKLTGFLYPYSSERYEEWLDFVAQIAYERIIRKVKSHSSTFLGDPLTDVMASTSLPCGSLHHEVEELCRAIIICRGLKEVPHTNNKTILKSLSDRLTEPLEIVYDGTCIYHYSLSERPWFESHSKDVWKLHGHFIHRNDHDCSITW